VNCVAAWHTKREAKSLPKKQAQERFIKKLLHTTEKPTQLSQAGGLCADNEKWDGVCENGMTSGWMWKGGSTGGDYMMEKRSM
jgi:hypothetical protein